MITGPLHGAVNSNSCRHSIGSNGQRRGARSAAGEDEADGAVGSLGSEREEEEVGSNRHRLSGFVCE